MSAAGWVFGIVVVGAAVGKLAYFGSHVEKKDRAYFQQKVFPQADQLYREYRAKGWTKDRATQVALGYIDNREFEREWLASRQGLLATESRRRR
jgi:hypothetical protein